MPRAHLLAAPPLSMRYGAASTVRWQHEAAAAKEPPSHMKQLERLQNLPVPVSSFLRLIGMFTDKRLQTAAGYDMHKSSKTQAGRPEFFEPAYAAVDTRFYTRFQLLGLHAWLFHTRLRTEPREKCATQFEEAMEKLWDEVTVDMGKMQELEFLQIIKFLKELQLGWHGLCKNLDKAVESDDPRTEMSQLLLRNVYVDATDGNPLEGCEPAALWLADYLIAQAAHHEQLPSEQVLSGAFTWAPLPPPREGAELQGGVRADEPPVENA